MPGPARKPGTLFDTVERLPDVAPPRATMTPPAPAPTFGETFSAAKQVQFADNSDFEDRLYTEGWAPIVEALGLDASENPGAQRRPVNLGIGTGGYIPQVRSSLAGRRLVSPEVHERLIFEQIRARRAKDPNFLKGVPDTREGMRAYFIEQQKAKRNPAIDTVDRSEGVVGGLASLAGSAWGALHDPINIVTLPIGGGGRTVLQVVARETLVNGAISAVEQPFVARNRETLGEELTLGEAAGNVVIEGLAGGLLEGGVHLGAKGAVKLNDVLGNPAASAANKISGGLRDALLATTAKVMRPGEAPIDAFGNVTNRELVDFMRSSVGESMTPDERAAIRVLERESDIGATSPYTPDADGQAKHDGQLADAINDLIENRRPQDLPSRPVVDAGATAPARPPAPASSTGAARPRVASGPVSLPGDVVDGLKARGIPDHVARGAAAGIVAESRASHSIVNPTSGAFGLGQWLGPRKRELFRRYGPSPSREQQLDFLAWELKGGDHGGRAVLGAKDEVAALNAYIVDFMRPGKGRETTGDLSRGMAALGRGGEQLPAGTDVAGGGFSPIDTDDPAIARLREEALRLEDQVVAGAPGVPTMYARSYKPDEITVDAARFQFKGGGDEFGVTDRLKGVTEWNPLYAGRVVLWEDAGGKVFLADGHQRHGLARRIQADGGDVRMDGIVLREGDGVTAEDARVYAALKNIAEGTGSSVDAAKVMKERPDALAHLPPKSALVRDGAALARLSDEAFGAVYNEVVPADFAAVIGHLLPDSPEVHGAMIELLIKLDPANRGQAESLIRQGIAAGLHKEEQIDLFGSSSNLTSLFVERAKVLEKGLARIRKMRLVHSTAAKEADALEASGSKIAREQSAKEAQANAEAVEIVSRLAFRAGPVADALDVAARQLAGGGRLTEAVDKFVADVRGIDLAAVSRAVANDVDDRLVPDGAGRGGDAGDEIPALPDEQPSLGDLLGATERFSDPDGKAVQQQAESLVHDLRNDYNFLEISGDTSHLPNIDVPLEPPAVSTAPAGQATEIFGEWLGDWGWSDELPKPTSKAAKAADANEAVQDAIAKAADALAMKAKREISIEFPDDADDIELEGIEQLAKRVLAGEDPEKVIAAAIKDGRLVVEEGAEPELVGPNPDAAKPSGVVPVPEAPKRSADYAGEIISQAEAKAKLEEWKAEALRIGRESPPPPGTVILSLFDSSGRFSQPYRDMGYEVIQIDKNLGVDVIEDISMIQHAIEEVKAKGGRFAGVLAQPPCTTFAGSGARWWDERHNRNWYNAVRKMWGARAAKLFDSPVEYNQFLVATTEEFISRAKPDFFVMENPRGRIAKLNGLPKANLEIEPHHFGDAYTKNTFLYGKFNNELETANVSPKEEDGGEGSRMHKLRSNAEKDDGLRSLTPEGFAYAFALANRPGTDGAPAKGVLHADNPDVDPAIAERQRQEIQLRGASPLRPGDVDAKGELGLELFDSVNQPELTFRLGEEGGEISPKDLLAELDADDAAIAAIKGCL